jgi:hypothetical protein
MTSKFFQASEALSQHTVTPYRCAEARQSPFAKTAGDAVDAIHNWDLECPECSKIKNTYAKAAYCDSMRTA